MLTNLRKEVDAEWMTEAENDVLTATAYAFLLYLHHRCSIGYTYRTRLWSSRRNHRRSWMSQRYQDVPGWLCKRHHKVAVNILLSTDHTTISWTLICVIWGLESIPHAGSVNKTRCPFKPWLESISERIYAPPVISEGQERLWWRSWEKARWYWTRPREAPEGCCPRIGELLAGLCPKFWVFEAKFYQLGTN